MKPRKVLIFVIEQKLNEILTLPVNVHKAYSCKVAFETFEVLLHRALAGVNSGKNDYILQVI